MERVKIIITINSGMRFKEFKKFAFLGGDIFRLNTKYISPDKYDWLIEEIRKVKNCKIMFDIKKRSHLKELAGKDFDYLALSFAEDSREVARIKKMFPDKKIISKIESKRGVKNIKKLIEISDGIMIARGDLGHEIKIEKIPFVQKMITKECNKRKKFSITATEIMPSMVRYKRPSRAEVSDVVNALLEGCDGLLLAEETAIGENPFLAVEKMREIIEEVERWKKDSLKK